MEEEEEEEGEGEDSKFDGKYSKTKKYRETMQSISRNQSQKYSKMLPSYRKRENALTLFVSHGFEVRKQFSHKARTLAKLAQTSGEIAKQAGSPFFLRKRKSTKRKHTKSLMAPEQYVEENKTVFSGFEVSPISSPSLGHRVVVRDDSLFDLASIANNQDEAKKLSDSEGIESSEGNASDKYKFVQEKPRKINSQDDILANESFPEVDVSECDNEEAELNNKNNYKWDVSGMSPTVNSIPNFLTQMRRRRSMNVDTKAEDNRNSGESSDSLASLWNESFQNILELEEEDKKNELLVELAQDFRDAAAMYGEIINSEKFLPNNKKTIKPVSIGGFAGGEVSRFFDVSFLLQLFFFA